MPTPPHRLSRPRSILWSPLTPALAVALALSACAADPAEPAVTYNRDVLPLVEANCLTCHSQGGIGPIALDDWETIAFYADEIVDQVERRQMPPWQPDPDCRVFRDSRRLTDADIAVFTGWRDEGFAEGRPVPADATPVVEQAESLLGEPQVTLQAAASYVPDRERPDDYRCLPLGEPFARETLVHATTVDPDVLSLVHHVVVFVVEADGLDDMRAFDDEDEAVGYTCFGDAKAGSGRILGTWTPGAVPEVLPDGAAAVLPRGSQLVMQVHYNLSNYGDDAVIPADHSALQLWTMPEGEVPTLEAVNFLYPSVHLDVPAGQREVVVSRDFRIPVDGSLVAVFPHMHLLGEHIRVELLPEASDDDSSCLVDIPAWDFNWQQTYAFREREAIPVHTGDVYRQTCVYDNSAHNQPVVNGERLDPVDVTWGEGTFDEMCLTNAVVLIPYGEPVQPCTRVPECVHSCDESGYNCFFDCMLEESVLCSQCLEDPYAVCSAEHCLDEGLEVFTCFDACLDPVSCFISSCTEPLSRLYTCLEPHLLSGACNDYLSQCGVEF